MILPEVIIPFDIQHELKWILYGRMMWENGVLWAFQHKEELKDGFILPGGNKLTSDGIKRKDK